MELIHLLIIVVFLLILYQTYHENLTMGLSYTPVSTNARELIGAVNNLIQAAQLDGCKNFKTAMAKSINSMTDSGISVTCDMARDDVRARVADMRNNGLIGANTSAALERVMEILINKCCDKNKLNSSKMRKLGLDVLNSFCNR